MEPNFEIGLIRWHFIRYFKKCNSTKHLILYICTIRWRFGEYHLVKIINIESIWNQRNIMHCATIPNWIFNPESVGRMDMVFGCRFQMLINVSICFHTKLKCAQLLCILYKEKRNIQFTFHSITFCVFLFLKLNMFHFENGDPFLDLIAYTDIY